MIRHSSIVVGLAGLVLVGLAIAPSHVRSEERAPYVQSVLFDGGGASVIDLTQGFALEPMAMDFDARTELATEPVAAPDSTSLDSLAIAGSAGVDMPGSHFGTALGALLGGAALGVAGYAAGGGFAAEGDDDWVGFKPAFGLFVGNALGAAAGAHLANGRRGSFGTDLTVSALTALLGMTLVFAGPVAWVVAPLLQAALVASAERGSAEKHASGVAGIGGP